MPRASAPVAVLVVVLAFGLGYGVRRIAEDDGDEPAPPRARAVPAGVTFRQAASVPIGTTRRELLRRLRGARYEVRRNCLVYGVSDRAGTGWRFCFKGGRLASSSTSPL